MKLYEIAQEIDELDGKEIYQRYYNDIPLNDYIKIVNSDPNTRYPQKIGKYSKILINLYKNGQLKMEDLPKATEYLIFAYKYGVALDINKIKSLVDIFESVKKFIARESNDSSITSQSLNPNEYDTLFKGNDWIVYTPKTQRAACYLGAGTQWCTTWGKESLNPSYRNRESHYPRYSKQGTLYIIVNRNDTEIKYQFHFESRQYMDRNDRDIKTETFLDENPELKYFFFPSFVKEVNEDSRKSEYEKMDILSEKDRNDLIKKTLSPEDFKRPIINKILVDSRNNFYDLEFGRKERMGEYYDQLNSVISHLRYVKSESHSYTYDQLMDYEFEWGETLLEPFKEYYEENKENIRRLLSIYDFDSFKVIYYNDFSDDENIQDKFRDETVDQTSEEYSQDAQSEFDRIEKYIKIDDGYTYTSTSTVSLSISYLIPFIISEEINDIDDTNKSEVIDDFIYNYDLSIDPELNSEIIYAKYSNQDSLYRAIDNYFDNIILERDNENCIEVENKFKEIWRKLFKGRSTFDNEKVNVKLNTYTVDCEKESINVTFKNKETGKEYTGEVKVINLPNYINNYQLFEDIIRFKRFI